MERPAARITRGRSGAAFCSSAPRPEAVSENAPRQRHPGSPLPVASGRGPSRAHTAPVRTRPFPVPANPVVPGHPARLWPPSPQLAGHVYIRRMLLQPPQGSQALPGSACRRKCPADLPLRAPTTVGTATRKYLAAVPRIAGRQPAGLGRQHQRCIDTSVGYQQVSLSVTASVQGKSGALRHTGGRSRPLV